MAAVIFASSKPHLAISFQAHGEPHPIRFVDGLFSTSDKAVQDFLKGHPLFGHVITLAPTALELARGRVAEAREAHDLAAKQLKAAEAELAGLERPEKAEKAPKS